MNEKTNQIPGDPSKILPESGDIQSGSGSLGKSHGSSQSGHSAEHPPRTKHAPTANVPRTKSETESIASLSRIIPEAAITSNKLARSILTDAGVLEFLESVPDRHLPSTVGIIFYWAGCYNLGFRFTNFSKPEDNGFSVFRSPNFKELIPFALQTITEPVLFILKNE